MSQEKDFNPEIDAHEPIAPNPARLALAKILEQSGIYLFPSDRSLAMQEEQAENA